MRSAIITTATQFSSTSCGGVHAAHSKQSSWGAETWVQGTSCRRPSALPRPHNAGPQPAPLPREASACRRTAGPQATPSPATATEQQKRQRRVGNGSKGATLTSLRPRHLPCTLAPPAHRYVVHRHALPVHINNHLDEAPGCGEGGGGGGGEGGRGWREVCLWRGRRWAVRDPSRKQCKR